MSEPAKSGTSVLQMVASIGQGVGGPPRSVSALSKALADCGVDVSLIAGVWPDDPNVPIDPRIRLIEVPGSRLRFAGVRWIKGFGTHLQATFVSDGPNIIHMHGLWLNVCRETAAFARKRNCPLVVSPRGMLEPWALSYKAWKKKLVWQAFQKRDLEAATAFHATAYSEAESIRRLGFKQPIAVIPNGIVMPKIGTDQLETGKPKTETKTALFLSRINPKKGLPMLLEAWARVAPADWRLVIAGNDDSNHLPVVEARIQSLGLADRVSIAGPLFGEAKEKAFREADLFVLPSYSENFGIVVAEALGYGLPVLTTTGCPWQELDTERCGWWVEPNPEGIEDGLLRSLATSNENLVKMGLRGRQLVEQHYLWPAIGSSMQSFYRWMAGEGEKPKFVV